MRTISVAGVGSQNQSTIEEGARVREFQNVIRLPDLSSMQVKVLVHESKVDRVRPGNELKSRFAIR